MWTIGTKRVLPCTSELPTTFPQLPSTVINHWALNTTFAHLFLNIFKEIWLLQKQRLPACSRGARIYLPPQHETWLQGIPRSRREFKYNLLSVFTWRQVRHIGVLKQWNGGHIGVSNQSCGSWTFFLYKYFLLFNEFLKLLDTWLATWVKTLYINKKFSTQYFYYGNSFNWVEKCIIQFWMTKIVAIKAKDSQHCSLLLACKKCSLHPQTRCSRFTILSRLRFKSI